MAAPIRAERCSKWYGQVLGVSDIDWTVEGGVVGLLGPNGAGKSTLMRMVAGLLQPSRGSLTVFGESPWSNTAVRARIGYCPEHDGLYDELSATEFVAHMAALSGVANPRKAAQASLEQMGLEKAMYRRLGGFSKGMRQRTKLAQALVHDPDLLLLDEPLTGVDPVARIAIIDRISAFAKSGRAVLISSHVLYEIESLTEDIVVIYRGQILAEGNLYRIRQLIDKRPHRIRIECDRPRALGQRLAASEHISQVSFEADALAIETRAPDACYDLIADVAIAETIRIDSLTTPDNNLQSVFDYLTSGAA